MPRFLVVTKSALKGSVASAADSLRSRPDVSIVSDSDPDVVTIDTSEETAAELRRSLAGTHFVEAEVHRRIT